MIGTHFILTKNFPEKSDSRIFLSMECLCLPCFPTLSFPISLEQYMSQTLHFRSPVYIGDEILGLVQVGMLSWEDAIEDRTSNI
ncbi:unnamed protein product [Eruca vesicaria subsp. sativa]|uniref:Uncharacterized protein n=1 Tax=Eruca vesicaria subsp. sativa TaxID=29727 RepID=A0ABC8M0M0_ERUVS|nr:unnamed protein product [Eruca vesicaria subsp. sativa]